MLAKISRIFYGWRMIAVGSALRILGGGLYYYGFSVFFLPLSHDLGLSRAATSLVFSLARAQGAFEGPVAGYIMDRFGPRPLILTAIMMNGVGHMLLSNVHSYFALVLIYMGVVSLFDTDEDAKVGNVAHRSLDRVGHERHVLDQRFGQRRRIFAYTFAGVGRLLLGLAARRIRQRDRFSVVGITAGPVGPSFAGEHGAATRW